MMSTCLWSNKQRGVRLCAAGRSGTAYSLLTREELPYLLDLHLFLSRPVRAAPEQTLSAAAVAAERLDAGASIYGSFPQVGFNCLHSAV